jgi:membrane protease YdiL (CAAX protease family)
MSFDDILSQSIPVVITSIYLLIIHKWVGKYPEPLPRSENPKKETKEALFLYFILMIVSITTVLVAWIYFPSFISESYSVNGILYFMALITIPGIILPALYVTRINKWNLEDLGITTQVLQPKVAIAALIFALGTTGFRFITSNPEAIPPIVLILVLYETCFFEEFFFRGIILSKFERSMGQKKALIWSSIIFGVLHIFTDFVFPILLGGNVGTVVFLGSFMLIQQILSGLNFGIVYMKTRNLFVVVIIHYLNNYLAAIIVSFIA